MSYFKFGHITTTTTGRHPVALSGGTMRTQEPATADTQNPAMCGRAPVSTKARSDQRALFGTSTPKRGMISPPKRHPVPSIGAAAPAHEEPTNNPTGAQTTPPRPRNDTQRPNAHRRTDNPATAVSANVATGSGTSADDGGTDRPHRNPRRLAPCPPEDTQRGNPYTSKQNVKHIKIQTQWKIIF